MPYYADTLNSLFVLPSWESLGLNKYIFTFIVLYLTTIRLLRFRRRDSWASKYGYQTRADLERMKLEDAAEIVRELGTGEFPFLFANSVAFAILKTYGIPEISKLLVATRQLVDEKIVIKRNADTLQLMLEIILNPPSTTRHITVLARMNYLHAGYRASNLITDQDMLYVLSLFALEPVRWTSKFGYRDLTSLEKAALGVFWRYVAEAAEIDVGGVMEVDEEEGRDGGAWMEALELWSLGFEERRMVWDEANVRVTEAQKGFLMGTMPRWLRGCALGVVGVIMGERLRKATGTPSPTLLPHLIFSTITTLHSMTTLLLLPPRPHFLRTRWFTSPSPSTGLINATRFTLEPWYVKPTLLSRWGWDALLARLAGLPLPGDDGDRYQPQGYRISDLGPERFAGKGGEEMEGSKERIVALQRHLTEKAGRGSTNGSATRREHFVHDSYANSVNLIYRNPADRAGVQGELKVSDLRAGGSG